MPEVAVEIGVVHLEARVHDVVHPRIETMGVTPMLQARINRLFHSLLSGRIMWTIVMWSLQAQVLVKLRMVQEQIIARDHPPTRIMASMALEVAALIALPACHSQMLMGIRDGTLAR
jgi:hypothetical protein